MARVLNAVDAESKAATLALAEELQYEYEDEYDDSFDDLIATGMLTFKLLRLFE